ncbi:MAG: hypothetical protein NZ932_03915 [Candidatus Bathyarchaeota archaeon]|nr:hypothetical protein [Candidatus Bathyarchaeota archaeon]MDW8022386.1 hypothetical protein [Nitrososphaerota archaeon]
MNECEQLGKRFLPVTRAESLNSSCLIDFKDPDVKSEVEYIVECEDRCAFEADYDTPEYEECVDSCKETVETSVSGSIVVDKQSLEVKESTIPVSCLLFMEQENGGYAFSFGEQRKIFEKLENAGCEAMDGGWIHAHEFVPKPVEIEEEYPAICYIHVKSKGEGKCKLPKVLQILGMQRIPEEQATLDRFV